MFATLLASLLTAAPAPLPPIPTDAECTALGQPRLPLNFRAGERLEYDVDAVGMKAASLSLRVLPSKDGAIPVEAKVETNTFFAKIRRVTGTGTSYLDPKTLRPLRYTEESVENGIPKSADISFSRKDKSAALRWGVGDSSGLSNFRFANDALDPVGTAFLFRQMPLKQGQKACFDAYGIRRMWRVWGTITGKEHVSLPVGEFEAWHLEGTAVRMDNQTVRREIHYWISDDPRHLPLAALGSIDLGAVRATLTAYDRPNESSGKAESKANLKW